MNLSAYYQAKIERERTWFFTATLRSFEHLCFDRTCDVEHGVFEFFVTPGRVDEFEFLMRWYAQQNIVIWWNKVEQDKGSALNPQGSINP